MEKEKMNLEDENLDEVTNNENLTDEEYIEKLTEDLEEQTKKADEYFEHLKRNMAEFDNYKKRVNKEKETMFSTITSDIVADLLPILDNFEKAINTDTQDESFKNGMEMIKNQIQDVLKKLGVEEIVCINKTFDPNYHEAVMHVEDDKYGEKEIVEVFRKGYKIGEKVVRHSMVKVAN